MANHNLVGSADDRKIFLDGIELSPTKSQKVNNHSPDGFNWGYGGSGPAQLALAICMELYSEKNNITATTIYQDFKWKVITKLPQGKDFSIIFDDTIGSWDFKI